MKTIILLVVILGVAYSHNMVLSCECNSGLFIDPVKNRCVPNPADGEIWFI